MQALEALQGTTRKGEPDVQRGRGARSGAGEHACDAELLAQLGAVRGAVRNAQQAAQQRPRQGGVLGDYRAAALCNEANVITLGCKP